MSDETIGSDVEAQLIVENQALLAEVERLRAKIEEMAKCCDAQEHGQIGCRCAGYNVSCALEEKT